jgi:hypothetical protein
MPTGHKAVFIQITDRVFADDLLHPGSYADAYLQFITFIVVKEHVKAYPAVGQPYATNSWPFSQVEILTQRTPDILPPAPSGDVSNLTNNGLSSIDYPSAFFPLDENGAPCQFALRLTDLTGKTTTGKVPLAFVFKPDGFTHTLNQFNDDPADMGPVITAYNQLGQSSSSNLSMVTLPLPGEHIRLAPEVTSKAGDKPGGTTYPTLGIVLGAASPANVPNPTNAVSGPQFVPPVGSPTPVGTLAGADQPCFYPSIMSAYVRVPAAETLSRGRLDDSSPGSPGGVNVHMYGNYVAEGFQTPKVLGHPVVTNPAGFIDPSNSTNPGSVFLGLLNAPGLSFPSDAVGGLANPNLGISGLSGAAGAIGGTIDQYANKAYSVISEYFGGILDANFLGGLKLSDILGEVLGGDVTGLNKNDPTNLGIPGIEKSIAQDGTITVSYTLKLTLRPDPLGVFNPTGTDPNGADQQFTLKATVTVSLSGKTTFAIEGSVDAFTITILSASAGGVIQIPFGDTTQKQEGATFSGGTGKKTDIKVHVGQPTFIGALSFVGSLEQFLQNIGGSGVSIDVGPTQIKASISLDLPSVGCGVFNLENMSLSAAVVVPFLGDPTTATFGFCSQEKPFSLTVMCFGGGGYCLVGVGLTSLQSVTASLDFEGQLGLDLGVASGSVSAMAGITFNYTAGKGATLTGFVKITGEVEVLGILSVTLELDLTLSYQFTGNICTGTATMKISVSLFGFSIPVSITVQKQFSGGQSPPAAHSVSRHALPHDAVPTPYVNSSQTTFADQMDQSAWSAYCTAFAA